MFILQVLQQFRKKSKFEAIMWSVQSRLPKQRRQESLERCSEI